MINRQLIPDRCSKNPNMLLLTYLLFRTILLPRLMKGWFLAR
jgi:hypothetical protein